MKIECPVWAGNLIADCPYCNEKGQCELPNPQEECDDYYAMVGDEE